MNRVTDQVIHMANVNKYQMYQDNNMGNNSSSASIVHTDSIKWGTARKKKIKDLPNQAESSRVLFLLYLIHRTWNIVVEHVDTKTVARRRRRRCSEGDIRDSDLASQYSFCSCTNCRCNDDCTSHCSDFSYTGNMAPNSTQSQRGAWPDDVSREKQRPPTYNPEDYAVALRKWSKRSVLPLPSSTASMSAVSIASSSSSSSSGSLAVSVHQQPPSPNTCNVVDNADKDYRNPCLSPGGEMSLRQFGSLSELLTKLREDLRLAFPSFVQEFISEPLDGVTLVVEALRSIQLSQGAGGTTASTTGTPGMTIAPRIPPQQQRRALLDELACLQCLQRCCQRYPESARRLVSSSAGLYALAACIMSTVNKSRILALQLLTVACEVSAAGHAGVSEALSTLRLRYGEPCRFRFLAGMVQSGAGGGELQASGLRLLAALLSGAPTPQRRLYLQAELDQAGLDVRAIKKAVSRNATNAEMVLPELVRYEQQLIDVDGLSEKACEAEKEKDDLKSKLELLEKKVQILQEEKGILMSLEQCLKERCCELQEEVTSLRSENVNTLPRKKMISKQKTIQRDVSSPPEDEGISSSERSLSPDGDLQREPMVYEVFNVQNETILMRSNQMQDHAENDTKKLSDDDDETTIEEVIEELRNIINDAESEQYEKEKAEEKCRKNAKKENDPRKHQALEKRDSVTSTKHNIIITDSNEYNVPQEIDSENDIVPVKLLPQPPRKSKSLVHLYIPTAEQGVIYNKNNKRVSSYDDDNFYSSDEGSDSLLSASRCQPQPVPKQQDKKEVYVKTDNRVLLETIMDAREKAAIAERREQMRKNRTRSGEDTSRRRSVQRTDSFKRIEPYNDNYKVKRDSYDGLYYIADPHDSSNNMEKNRDKWNSRQHEDYAALIEAKKMTKSLDRMDEGLHSMVDIVLTSENSKNWANRKARNSNIDPDLITPIISPSKRRVSSRNSRNSRGSDVKYLHEDYEITHHSSMDQSHRLYLPNSRLSCSSFEQMNKTNTSNSPFLIKRGHANAGLYSGEGKTLNVGIPRISLASKDINRALSPSGVRNMSSNMVAKLTDMPSGLY